MSLATQPLSLNINGKDVGPIDVPEGLMMIDFLHEYLAPPGRAWAAARASATPAW